MPRDIKELLNEGANPPRKGPNMDAIMRRSRTITWQRRAGATAGVLAISLAAFAIGMRVAPDDLTNANPGEIAGSPTAQPGIVTTPDAGEPSPEPELVETQYEVWFAHDQAEMLVATYVDDVVTKQMEEDEGLSITASALVALVGGPSGDEATAIPDGTKFIDAELHGNNALVNFSSEFASGGGSASMQMRVAQVVWTVTQLPHIQGVLFAIEDERITTLGGEGIDLSEPQTRADWMQFAPPITVDSPVRNAEVSSPLTVSGTANTFEATLQMRIVDSEGNEVGPETFDTATCGTGCRGDYEHQVEFEVSEETSAFLEVYSRSAENGEDLMFMIRIPVTLLP
jgi:spore germination protein GerM